MTRTRSVPRLVAILSALAIALPGIFVMGGVHTGIARAAATATAVQLTDGGTVTPPAGGLTDISLTNSEIPSDGADAGDTGGSFSGQVNRTLGPSKGHGSVGVGASMAKSNPNFVKSFDGLNLFDERYSGPAGQHNFQFEPPDQGLCAGNGYVVDGVNDAMSVYNQSTGTRVAGPTSLNAFFGFPPQIGSATGPPYGPRPTDPSCYYDPGTQRFFFTILTLDYRTNGTWGGVNELDTAVSTTSNPLGSWHIWRVNVTFNGPSGCPCLADFPHIAADANGFYITVDNFPLVHGGYNDAQVYAFSKQAMEGNSTSISGWYFDTTGMVTGDPGYKVWPATAPAGKYETNAGGTEYFLSSTYDACAACTTSDNRIAVWALTHTSNLSGPNPPSLSNTLVTVNPYADPPFATQKSGDHPYGQLGGHSNVGLIQTNDAGNLTTYFANGKLWGALITDVTVGGNNEAGIAYYIIKPDVSTGNLTATLALQGTLAGSNGQSVIFPSIGVTPSGRGVMTYTLTGPNDFPSAAFSSLDAKTGAGPITVPSGNTGVGPTDGFTEYSSRPRWGDYGAASVDGNNIWIASEYIGQSCTVTQYLADFTCGGTRGSAANWDTRISELGM